MREYKGYTSMNSTKNAHELQKKNSRDEQGAWKDRVSDWSTVDPGHYRCATLITRKSITVQALGSGYGDPGESETPQRVV